MCFAPKGQRYRSPGQRPGWGVDRTACLRSQGVALGYHSAAPSGRNVEACLVRVLLPGRCPRLLLHFPFFPQTPLDIPTTCSRMQSTTLCRRLTVGTRRISPISDTEMEVLKALWDHGPGTVRELHALLGQRGSKWA